MPNTNIMFSIEGAMDTEQAATDAQQSTIGVMKGLGPAQVDSIIRYSKPFPLKLTY